MTSVGVLTASHSVTHVVGKLLKSVELIVRESGLDPTKITTDWRVLNEGISTWLRTQDLEALVLEVYNPAEGVPPAGLVGRWDFAINYHQAGDGSLTLDADQVKYAIRKAGLWPSQSAYRIVATTKPNRPDVAGWTRTELRSTAGFTQHAIGTTIGSAAIDASATYWKKKP